MNKVSIVTEGKKITGWNTVKINKSISTLADQFTITFSDKWVDQFPEIYTGLQCVIKIDDESVLTGYIDNVSTEASAESIKFSITGRSKTGDLVDCEKIDPPFTWKNLNLYRIAKEICEPFSINVLFESPTPGNIFAEASIDQNESYYDFLYKLAKQRKFLLVTNVNGDLVFTNAGNNRSFDALIQGYNIASIKGNFNFLNRFSHYKIKGQQKTIANESSWNDSTISISADARDEQITRYRPKMITSNTKIDTNSAQQQVRWEAQIRAGRSTKFSIIVPTWKQSNGSLWRENLLVYIQSPLLRLDGEYLLESIDHELNETSLFSTLNFVGSDTYSFNPSETIKKLNKETGKYGWIS